MLFELGQIVATPAALELLEQHGLNALQLVRLHVTGEYGDLCADDKQRNKDAIEDGGRIFSSYKMSDGTKIYVITEAQDDGGRRQSTCILLADQY